MFPLLASTSVYGIRLRFLIMFTEGEELVDMVGEGRGGRRGVMGSWRHVIIVTCKCILNLMGLVNHKICIVTISIYVHVYSHGYCCHGCLILKYMYMYSTYM